MDPADTTDEQLVATYVAADSSRDLRQAAFNELVVRYRRRLFAVCVRILHSPHDAEEAVQETFVRLARHAAQFRGDAQLSTWLYRVANNVCTDRIRYEARRPATPVDDLTLTDDRPDPSDPFTGHAELEQLGAALAQLDERSRTLLLLVGVDGLSYAEAAEATGLAVGTVKSRVSRARARLGELLLAANDDAQTTVPTRGAEREAAQASDPDPGAPPRGPPGPG